MSTVQYPLIGRMDYTRRPTASALMFSVAQQLLKHEAAGEVLDFAIITFSPGVENEESGDYVAKVFMQSEVDGE